MILVTGDFNIPLHEVMPYICTPDKKFAKAPQSDRTILQDLISELRLVAPHCKLTFRYTFVHGTHDYIFIRQYQLRWKQMTVQTGGSPSCIFCWKCHNCNEPLTCWDSAFVLPALTRLRAYFIFIRVSGLCMHAMFFVAKKPDLNEIAEEQVSRFET